MVPRVGAGDANSGLLQNETLLLYRVPKLLPAELDGLVVPWVDGRVVRVRELRVLVAPVPLQRAEVDPNPPRLQDPPDQSDVGENVGRRVDEKARYEPVEAARVLRRTVALHEVPCAH